MVVICHTGGEQTTCVTIVGGYAGVVTAGRLHGFSSVENHPFNKMIFGVFRVPFYSATTTAGTNNDQRCALIDGAVPTLPRRLRSMVKEYKECVC